MSSPGIPHPNGSLLIISDDLKLLEEKLERRIPTGYIIINGRAQATQKFCEAVQRGKPVFVFKVTRDPCVFNIFQWWNLRSFTHSLLHISPLPPSLSHFSILVVPLISSARRSRKPTNSCTSGESIPEPSRLSHSKSIYLPTTCKHLIFCFSCACLIIFWVVFTLFFTSSPFDLLFYYFLFFISILQRFLIYLIFHIK